MKTALLIFILSATSLLGYTQTTYVPDDNFEQALINLGYDDVLDDAVLTANINTITTLNVFNKNISDMTGIEDFVALTSLSCHQNQIASLDVTQLINLNFLRCEENQLSSLDVTQNTLLTNLFCQDNQLTSLDISQLTVLDYIRCANNQLTTLDISQNVVLTTLFCDNNQLTNINTSANPQLWKFVCGWNALTDLDLSLNPDLWELNIESNQFTSIDVSHNLDLESIDCSTNQITDLDFSVNTSLRGLTCRDNQLTELDLHLNTALIVLRCEDNLLTSVDVRNGNNTNFIDLNTTNNPNLTCIFVDDVAYAEANFPYVDASSTFVVTQAQCDALGITEERLVFDLKLYPNPVSTSFHIQTNSKIENVILYDVFGKKIKTFTTQKSYNISNLKEGIYLLKVASEDQFLFRKIVVN